MKSKSLKDWFIGILFEFEQVFSHLVIFAISGLSDSHFFHKSPFSFYFDIIRRNTQIISNVFLLRFSSDLRVINNYKTERNFKCRISSNKHPRCLYSFEFLRCSAYWRVVLKGKRYLFQCKINFSHKMSKLYNFFFRNNNN